MKQKIVRLIAIFNYYTRKALDAVLKYVRKYGIVMESRYPFGGHDYSMRISIIRLLRKSLKSVIRPEFNYLTVAAAISYIAIPGSSNPKHMKKMMTFLILS